jgi:hypothetical protein
MFTRLIVSAVVLVYSSTGNAQDSTAVAVMLQSDLPSSSPVVVVRRANQHPHDVILVRDLSLPTSALSGAIHSVRMLRARDGVKPKQSGRFRPTLLSVENDSAVERSVRSSLARLANAPERFIAGVGSGKTIDLYLSEARDRFAKRGETVLQAAQKKRP